ncbi:Histidine-binding periplasmic protein [compost metagenome]
MQVSTTNAEFIQATYGKTSDIRLYNTQDDCTADLVSGRIDAMFLDNLGNIDFLKSDLGAMFEEKGTGSVRMDPLKYGLGVAAGLRKDDTTLKARIDLALAQLYESGKYTQLSKQYFDTDIWPK